MKNLLAQLSQRLDHSDRSAFHYISSHTLFLFIPLLLILIGGYTLYTSQQTKKVESSVRTNAQIQVEQAWSMFEHRLDNLGRDVRYLSRLVNFASTAHSDTDIDAVAQQFAQFMQANRAIYDSIRFIDTEGLERVKIENKHGNVTITPPYELQDKHDRYYVEKTLDLAPEAIYISRFDLNIEHNKIELPHKPMLRISTPVVGSDNDRIGMVVINYRGQVLIDQLTTQRNISADQQFWLLNNQGYWLISPDEDDQWAFMFKDQSHRNAELKYPKLWQNIQSNPDGAQIKLEGNLFTYKAFDPSQQLGLMEGADHKISEESWYFVNYSPKEYLQTAESTIAHNALIAGVILSVILFLFCLNTAHASYKRKRTNDQLKVSRQYAHNLVEAIPDALIVTDNEGYIVLSNMQTTLYFGYTKQELLGQHIELLIPERYKKNHEKYRLNYVENPSQRGMGEGKELFGQCKDGKELPIQISLNTMQSSDGQLVICAIRDVTSEKIATAKIKSLNIELYQQNTQLSSLMERLELSTSAAGIGIWDWSIKDNTLFWDDQMFALFGIQSTDFSHNYEAWLNAIHPDDKEMSDQAMQRALNDEAPFNIDFRISWPDGSIHYINGQGNVHRNNEGNPYRVIGTNHDITEYKLLEQELRLHQQKLEQRVAERTLQLEQARSQAERLSTIKSEFLANMSHEIRTPLNAILGFAYLLERNDLPPDVSSMITKICHSGRNLQFIINDILDFSKLEVGRLELDHDAFSLNDVLDSVASITVANMENKKLELVISPPPPQCNDLMGDGLRLGQILINLTNNAIKFTEQGHVWVDITKTEEVDDTVTLAFIVKDTGIGISPEKQQQIFEPFTQADSSTTRQYGGTGLGLSISRQLITMMGGTLQLTSEKGVGSIFSFALTFNKSNATSFSQPEMTNLNVLIADDHDIARAALNQTALSLGWRPDSVNSGEEAVSHVLAKEGEPIKDDVVIMDWDMPGGIDGLTAARQIHDHLGNDRSPIIIMVTAHSRAELEASPNVEYSDVVLTKPVTASSLYDAVSHAMQERHPEQLASKKPTLQQRLVGLNILVVDDSDINRDVAQRIFEDEGAIISLANDGLQAYELIKKQPSQFDVVLMDIQMPIMDGYEATQAIRQSLNLRQLPIVALTAGAFKGQKDRAFSAGMDGFIPKPFDVNAAIMTILSVVGKPVIEPESSTSHDAVSTPPDSTATTPSSWPGLDVEYGLTLWKDEVIYQQYLTKFVSDYGDFFNHLTSSDNDTIASNVHKLKGAAGALGLNDVQLYAGEAEHLLRHNESADAALNNLETALDQTVQSIAHYVSKATDTITNDDADTDAVEIDSNQLILHLQSALTALDTDNPASIDPAIAGLANLLPNGTMAPLTALINNFDFRAAETLIQQMAADYGLSIKDQEHQG